MCTGTSTRVAESRSGFLRSGEFTAHKSSQAMSFESLLNEILKPSSRFSNWQQFLLFGSYAGLGPV